MSVSGKTELSAIIPEVWSPNFYDELRASLVMGGVFSREYQGEIQNQGDKVRVSQIVAPTGEILTDDKDVFNREQMTVQEYTIEVNKRAVAAFEFTSLAQLQSLQFEQDAREALVYAVQKQIEDQVVAALVPSASAPDHDLTPATPGQLAAIDVANMRTLLSLQKVPKMNRWLFCDPQYFGDLLQSTNFISSEFIPAGSAVSSAEFASPLYGFRVAEADNLSADVAFAIHPSALQMVMQKSMTLKISDLHSQGKFGYVMSADLIFDLKLFEDTRIVKYSG